MTSEHQSLGSRQAWAPRASSCWEAWRGGRGWPFVPARRPPRPRPRPAWPAAALTFHPGGQGLA